MEHLLLSQFEVLAQQLEVCGEEVAARHATHVHAHDIALLDLLH